MAAPWAPIVANDVVSVTFRGNHVNQRILSTFHYQVVNAPTAQTPLDDALLFLFLKLVAAGGLREWYLACLSEDYAMESVRIQVVQPFRLPFIDFPTVNPGTVEEPSLPPGNSLVITRKGPDITRNNLGSLHLPAVPTTFAADGLITVAGIGALSNLATELLADITDGVGDGSLLTPGLINAQTPPGSVEFVPLQSSVVQQTVRTMSRRVVGRGE